MSIKCWKVTPYHNNEADFCIIPIYKEEDNNTALEYAKNRLEQLWDESYDDKELEIRVKMELIEMPETEVEDLEDLEL